MVMAHELDELEDACGVAGLRGVDGVGGAGETGRALKPKSSSLVIDSGSNSGVDCPEVGMESARELGEYSLSLSLFERYARVSSV